MNQSTSSLTRAALAAALYAFALLTPIFAIAAGWSIDPVRIELSPSLQTAVITVTNDAEQPTSMQIQTVIWTQVNGKDTYTPTRELLVTPPIVTIAPKSEQIIRVALRRPAATAVELAYRINLQELPTPSRLNVPSIQVALRISLPVFVQPQSGNAVPKLVWRFTRAPGNMLKVDLLNEGNAHIQISNLAFYAPGYKEAIASEAASTYVLAGQSREWLLKAPELGNILGDRLRLKADTDGNDIDSDIVLGR